MSLQQSYRETTMGKIYYKSCEYTEICIKTLNESWNCLSQHALRSKFSICTFIVKICLVSRVSLILYLSTLQGFKIVCFTERNQLSKHPEPLTKAKHKAPGFSSLEIKISCYTDFQAYITPLIFNTLNMFQIRMVNVEMMIMRGMKNPKINMKME